MKLEDWEIEEMIKEDLVDLEQDLRDHVKEIFVIKEEIDKHKAALACPGHDWHWQPPFVSGGLHFKMKKCSRCNCETEMTRVKN